MEPRDHRMPLPDLPADVEPFRALLDTLVRVFTDLTLADELRPFVAPDAVVQTRYERGEYPAQRHAGADAIVAWVAMPRAECRFFVESVRACAPDGGDELLEVRYGYDYEQYTQRGRWTLRLRDGLIRHMLHAPDSLPNTPRGWWEQYGIRVLRGAAEEPFF